MKANHRITIVVLALFLAVTIYFVYNSSSYGEKYMNYGPLVMQEIDALRERTNQGCTNPNGCPQLPEWKKAVGTASLSPCYGRGGVTPPFPKVDNGGGSCVAPYSSKCQNKAKKFPPEYYPCPPDQEKMDTKEGFQDWTMFNAPVINGYRPSWFSGPAPPSYLSTNAPYFPSGSSPMENGPYPPHIPNGYNYAFSNIAYQNAMDRMYNPLRYPYRSQAFYEQGWYPNMILPPQVIGGGYRRQGLLGGTQGGIPVVPPPIEISERNIAPVNITTRGPLGIPQQVGVLYKIFGSLNDALPLFGRRRYPNGNTWDYYTLIGPTGGKVKARVLTKRTNDNELGTNDHVRVEGSKAEYRVTVYESDFPQYVPVV